MHSTLLAGTTRYVIWDFIYDLSFSWIYCDYAANSTECVVQQYIFQFRSPSIQIFPIFFRLAEILCHTTLISGCLWSSCEISSVRPWYLGSAFSGIAMSHRLFLILQEKENSASLVLLLTKPQQRILILFSAVKVKNSIKTLTLRKTASLVVFTVTAALPCFFCSADLLCLATVLSIV